jgi:uncharacterized coiled-coil protein SlyX
MADLKHVGRHARSSKKCVVAYRVVPNDPDSCLVVFTSSLEAPDHESLMATLESNAGQNAYEFAEAMHRATLSDGRNMLVHFSRTGKLEKVPSTDIEMTPNTQTKVNLAELNKIIAQQKGVTVADLALSDGSKPKTNTTTTTAVQEVVAEPVANAVLSDEDLAAQYRSQADALYKEAKRLREQAEELVPTKKKATIKTAESA